MLKELDSFRLIDPWGLLVGGIIPIEMALGPIKIFFSRKRFVFINPFNFACHGKRKVQAQAQAQE
jgi:hypothetical protein